MCRLTKVMKTECYRDPHNHHGSHSDLDQVPALCTVASHSEPAPVWQVAPFFYPAAALHVAALKAPLNCRPRDCHCVACCLQLPQRHTDLAYFLTRHQKHEQQCTPYADVSWPSVTSHAPSAMQMLTGLASVVQLHQHTCSACLSHTNSHIHSCIRKLKEIVNTCHYLFYYESRTIITVYNKNCLMLLHFKQLVRNIHTGEWQ